MWNNGHKRDFALLLALTVGVAGCTKLNELNARRGMKAGNAAYTSQNYKKAVPGYEQAVANDPADEDLQTCYFFLANSYDNLWKAAASNDPARPGMLQKAIENYQKAAEKLATAQ